MNKNVTEPLSPDTSGEHRSSLMNNDLPIGSIFEDSYEILEHLGTGGFGVVLKVRDLHLNRVAALKLLLPELIAHKESRSRFRREGRILANLKSSHIVEFLACGELEDGRAYIVMEYVEGTNLQSVLQDHKSLPVERALNIANQACRALEAAHRSNIVHRDLKPTNIMLMKHQFRDYVKLVDFGVASVMYSSPIDVTERLTRSGLLLGSVDYMSPEQCLGNPVDERSDLYSLGCILYQMLSGRRPFEADNPIGLLHRHVCQPTPRLPPLSAELNHTALQILVDKAMAKEPDQRYQTARQLQHDIELVLAGKGKRVEMSNMVSKIKNWVLQLRTPPKK